MFTANNADGVDIKDQCRLCGKKDPTGHDWMMIEKGDDGLCFECGCRMEHYPGMKFHHLPRLLREYVEKLEKKCYYSRVLKLGRTTCSYKVWFKEEKKDSTDHVYHLIGVDIDKLKIKDTTILGTDLIVFAQTSNEVKTLGYKWYCQGIEYLSYDGSRSDLYLRFTYESSRPNANAIELSPKGFYDGRKLSAIERKQSYGSVTVDNHDRDTHNKEKYAQAFKLFKRKGGESQKEKQTTELFSSEEDKWSFLPAPGGVTLPRWSTFLTMKYK